MILELHVTASDWAACQAVLTQRIRARIGKARQVMAVAIPIAVTALLVMPRRSPLGSGTVLDYLAGAFATLCALIWSQQQMRQHIVPDPDGAILGDVRMELSPEGIRIVRKATVSLTEWAGLKGITRTGTHVLLWLDDLAALIVPLRDVPEGPKALLETIRGLAGPLPLVEVTSGHRIPSLPPEPSHDEYTVTVSEGRGPADQTPGFLPTLARRLVWRTVTRDADAGVVGSSDAMIAACACAALAVWLGYDRYVAGPNANWYPGGVASLAWYAMGLLGLAWVIHRAVPAGGAPFRPLLASIVAFLPLLLLLAASIRLWAPERIRIALFALLGLVLLLHLRRALPRAGVQFHAALVFGALYIATFAAATNAVWIHPQLWYAADSDDDDDDRSSVDSERLLFAQPDRIDEAAARMSPPQDHKPDVFFVGFAGVAEQKVFAEELLLTERVVTERYGAAGRSLLLINDKRDHDRWPIATVLGLRRALARVGARMNRDEDVLFLMLTSHGSAKPALSVSNGDWALDQLDGQSLRAALDESGIRWRVIVISACHSGAFIKPLADDGTIVLTASAKERTSFGCSDDADLTYFGQALMRDALPQAESLEAAFLQAKRAVATRERQEKRQASLPQAYFGSAIRDYWKQVEAARPRPSKP